MKLAFQGLLTLSAWGEQGGGKDSKTEGDYRIDALALIPLNKHFLSLCN
jgi:hypothetical protein